jgi:hypothetical protein
MFAKFKQAKPFRPQFSIGCLFDIATGRYEKGMKGENILNGGVANIEGVTGPGGHSGIQQRRSGLLISLCYDAGSFDRSDQQSLFPGLQS